MWLLRKLNKMENNFKKTAWAEAKINKDFICITTFSGYGICQMDPLGKENYSPPEVDDLTLGNMVLDALKHSRFVLPEPDHRKGIWVHPDATYDADLYDYKKAEDRYSDWVKSVMKSYGYKTKRAMFNKMKNCSISLAGGVLKITPYRHIKLEMWEGREKDGIEDVIIPGDSTPEEIGAALRLAFSQCID